MRTKGIPPRYSLEEIIPITKVAKNLNRLVASIREKALQRAIIVRNNQPEAVLLGIKEYEDLKNKEQALELMEINLIVQKRGKVARANTMSMKEMFDKSRANRKNKKA